MNKLEVLVFGAILAVAFHSEKCSSLDSHSVNVKVHFINNEDTVEKPVETLSRVTRQAYQGQNIYPSVPPYGSNQQHGHNQNNPYGSNYNGSGYPSYQGYQPTNFSSSGPYGQNSHSSPQNGYPGQHYNPNANNPYGTNYNNSGHSWHPQNGANHGNQYPQDSTSTKYPGFKPGTAYNPSSTPSYYPGQSNNSYPGQRPNNGQNPYGTSTGSYPQYPGSNYNPNTRPGQSNNTYPGYPGYGQNNPGHQNPVIYDNFTPRPGQNPYNSSSSNNWSVLNNTRPGYGNGQNYYPNSPGNGFGISNNTYNPSQPQYGQSGMPNFPGTPLRPSNNFSGGQYPNSGQVASPYNPYPNAGPYGPNNGPPQGYHDPTKVSPHHFNSN